MDLLEYKGKQVLARYGVPLFAGRAATTVDEAVAAGEQIGCPLVVKAQVKIGGRGKAGGIKLATTTDEVREHAASILGMDIRGHVVHELWLEAAADIASEYYAAVVFDRSAKAPLVMLSTQGGMDIEQVAAEHPEALATLHVDPLVGFQPFQARRLAFEAGVDADVIRQVSGMLAEALRGVRRGGRDARRDQPDRRHGGARGDGARREGHARRQRALPPSRPRGARRRQRRRSAGADGQGARADVRQARRRHRDLRQRRRARDVDARRRRPCRRRAGELPRRRRRREGRGDRSVGRRDPLEPERARPSCSTSSAGSRAATRSPRD